MKNNKKKVSYYQQHKNEEWFKEHRRLWAKQYREAHPELKKYMREYHKAYYAANKETLNEYRKGYLDTTRNERVNRFKQKERDNLGDNYIIQILIRRGKIEKQDVTPAMIKKRREQILQKRAIKNNLS